MVFHNIIIFTARFTRPIIIILQNLAITTYTR